MATSRRSPLDEQGIQALLDETGLDDPREAIRQKARELIAIHQACLADQKPPFNMEALASLRGIRPSDEPPLFSPDAEIGPDQSGNIILRLNRERPRTRQRFSIGHEIGHTFFKGYEHKLSCRKTKERDWADPADLVETLCDIAASEFLFPLPWFANDATSVGSATEMLQLARSYQASPDATIRRLVELRKEPTAAVFFSWRLKPTQQRRGVGDTPQSRLFGINAAEEAETLKRLRVDYCLPNTAFEKLRLHIPKHKSVENDGPIYQAALSNTPADGDAELNFGATHGDFVIAAVPLFTTEETAGPNGERCVVAVLRPA